MLKIVIVTTKGHFYSNIIIRKLMELDDIKIVGLVEGLSPINNKNAKDAFFYYLKNSGFLYVYHQLIKVIISSVLMRLVFILNKKESIYYPNCASNGNCVVLRTTNVNSKIILARIKKMDPDIIISLFTGLIFGEKILKLPSKGCINVHPSLLPQYKGVSPLFWMLLNDDFKNMGATMHYMTSKIDEGEIISQKKINGFSGATEHSLYINLLPPIFSMLKAFFEKASGPAGKKIPNENSTGSYYSFPTKQAVRQFSKKRKFHSLKELLFPKKSFYTLFK